MDFEEKIDFFSVPNRGVQSTASKGNDSKKISSRLGYSTQTFSLVPVGLHGGKNHRTGPEIPKHKSLTSVTDVNKHIRVKINLKELSKNKALCSILKKPKSKTDTMLLATNSRVKRDLHDQKASDRAQMNNDSANQMNNDSANQMNRDMPVIEDFIEETMPSTSQRKFDTVLSNLSEMFDDSELTKEPVSNGNSFVTFSFEKNVVKMNDGHDMKIIESVPKQNNVTKSLKHHDKASKFKKPNLCLSGPFVVCSIPDEIEPEVPEGEVDREQKSIVIVPNMPPRKNKPRRKKLSYKVQHRISLQPKALPVALPNNKFIEPANQPKIKPSLSVTSDSDNYNSRFAFYDNISKNKIRLALLAMRPLDFLIPMTASDAGGYSEKSVAQEISFDQLSILECEWLNLNRKLHYEVTQKPINCETILKKDIDFNVHNQRKRHLSEDIRCVTKRKRLPELENQDTTITNNFEYQICNENNKESSTSNLQNEKEEQGTKAIESKCSMKVPQNDDRKIIDSRNSTIGAIKKHQKVASKNIPWDYTLRTAEFVNPVPAELLITNLRKSLEKTTNNTVVSGVVDEGEDNVFEGQDASLSNPSDCKIVTVPETNEVQNSNDKIVLDECDTMSSENTEEEDYKIEIEEAVGSFLENTSSYVIPNDGSIWEITLDDSGAVIYENIAVDKKCISDEDDIKVETLSMHEEEYENLNTESPLVIAEKYVESSLIDEEQITVSDAETELFDEEIAVETELLNKDDDEEENTAENDIISLSSEENPEELESGSQVVDKEQTVNTDVERNPSNEKISTELHVERYSHNAHQIAKSDSKINNNILHNQPAEKSNVSNNCEYNEPANNSPNMNVHTHRHVQNLMRSIPEIRRTSTTSFEIRFNNRPTMAPYRQHQIEMERVLKETNSNNEMKAGKIKILENKIVKSNVSSATAEKQRMTGYQGMSMVSRNTTEQTKVQSVAKELQKSVIINYHQPVRTVPQQSVTTVPQQSVTTVSQQSVTTVPQQLVTKVPQQSATTVPQQSATIVPQQSVTTVPQQSVTKVPQQLATTVPQQSATIVPQQSVTTVPQQPVTTVPQQSVTTVSQQSATIMLQQPITAVPVTKVTNLQATKRDESGELRSLLTGNNQGTEQQNNEEKHLQTSMQNNNLLIQHSVQNVQHRQNGPIARENRGEIINIITLNNNDISVRQYNEIQVSNIPLQENNMIAKNPIIQHPNQMSMLSNNFPRPFEYTRNVAAVDQHTGNTVAQMPYQGTNIISQSSNQHYGVPQNANHQMPNNQRIQSGQYQPRRYAAYNEMNVPSMDLPGTGIVAQQNTQGQVITNHQSITEPTRNGLIQSTQGETNFNKGGTLGANNINMKRPSSQPVNNDYAVVPFRKNYNVSPRNAPLQQNVHQPGPQNHPRYPPPYPGHLLQQNTQVQSGTMNNVEHAASLETVHTNYVNTNIMYRHIMMQQHQMEAMNMMIMELNEALKAQTTNAPRRGGRMKPNKAIPPAVQNYLPQRFLENTGQQVYPVSNVSPENHGLINCPPGNDSQQMHPAPHISSEQQYLQYRNHAPVKHYQQVQPGPQIMPDGRGLTYRNRPAGNDSQQMHSVPHTQSEQHYQQYRNHAPVKHSQQVQPGPQIMPEERGLTYRNRPAGNDSQQMHPAPHNPSEQHYLQYRNHAPVKHSQQMQPGPQIMPEGRGLTYRNRPAGNDSQQMHPAPHTPSEQHYLQYRNHAPVKHSQQVQPGPQIMPESRGLTYRNRPPGNDSQQMHPAPHIPSEQHDLQYRNHAPVKHSQQVQPGPQIMPEGRGLTYRNRPPGIDSQQVSPLPRVPAENQYLKYQHRLPVKDSQQVNPVSHVPSEENSFKYTNRPPGMDSQQIQPVSRVPPEAHRLQYISQPPVQRYAQERYQRTSDQPASSAQNVTSAPSENTHYPKPAAVGSQNIPVIQSSASSGTSSYHQQGSYEANIYNGPVRNEAAVKLQNLHADRMHAQAQRKSPIDQFSNVGPLNLAIRNNPNENRSQQNDNVSNEPDSTSSNNSNHAENEYIDLEILQKQIQKKQGTSPRNESRDSGFLGSPGEGEDRHIICLRCGGPPLFKCSVCRKIFYCSTECQDIMRTIDGASCCSMEKKPKSE